MSSIRDEPAERTDDSPEASEEPSQEMAPSPETADGLWASLKQAVGGDHSQDYTEGPIGKAVLLLAVPMVLETVMESIFAVVDVFFVSKLGPEAVATIGLTESMMALIYTVAIGLSIGITAMVARRSGEKDPEAAATAAAQALFLGVGIAAILGLAGMFYAERLLTLMGAEEEVLRVGSGYTRIMIGANATVMMLFLINAMFRGVGDAVIAMRVLWLANGINIVLDPMLIFGIGPFPELGIEGAAIATNIGRGTAVVAQLWILARGSRRLKVAWRHLKVVPQIMVRLIQLSGTATFQFFISTASWIGLTRILAEFGSEVLAGYTIGIRVVLFALFPSWGVSNAAATMVGQALGAKKPERAEEAVWMTSIYNCVFLGVVSLLYLIFTPTIVGWFTQDPEPFRWAVLSLRTISSGFVFYAFGMVLTQSFNGAGDTWTPTYLNLLCFWMFELPIAFVLAFTFDLGPFGVFLAMTLAFCLLAVASVVMFRRGGWKTKTV